MGREGQAEVKSVLVEVRRRMRREGQIEGKFSSKYVF